MGYQDSKKCHFEDRCDPIPAATQELIGEVELKQTALTIDFSRIRLDRKPQVVLETLTKEAAWNLFKKNYPNLCDHATVRGLCSD